MNARLILLFAIVSTALPAQSRIGPRSATAGINAGNRAWIEGMEAGDVDRIGATYVEEAVDCDPTGECIKGRKQIERRIADQLASLGRVQSAVVNSWGMTERGSLAYEWGQAQATFESGKTLAEKYLTVWQRQSDGTWKILRNLVLP